MEPEASAVVATDARNQVGTAAVAGAVVLAAMAKVEEAKVEEKRRLVCACGGCAYEGCENEDRGHEGCDGACCRRAHDEPRGLR